MKRLTGVFLAGAILFLIGSGCGDSSDSASETGTTPAAENAQTTEAKSKPATPKERVREAVGDEVEAGGYAGTLEIMEVSFEGTEAQVIAKTPEGGFDGVKCGDLDDGAQAVFETVYNDGGWKGGSAVAFKGGLVDSATGNELPDANTGIYTMPAVQAKQINWSDEDALLNINWELYRDYCHQALQ
jgi:hypothetical protein